MDLKEHSSVKQKIEQQVKVWTEQTHTVYIVSLKTMEIYDSDGNILYHGNRLSMNLGLIGRGLRQFYNAYYLKDLLTNIDFDLIYTRGRRYLPFLNRVFKNHKVVMEINSNDLIEYKLRSNFLHYYNLYTRDRILKYVNGFISVSEELTKNFTHLNKPTRVISNGINTALFDLKYPENIRPKLVFVGSPGMSWHGSEKIKILANHFKEFYFSIIGEEGKDEENLKYHGYLSQKETTEIIQESDVAISTLALYMKLMKEASPLKSRQYLACGVPIIYAYNDTDINKSIDFALKLPNTEDNIDTHLNEIKKFIHHVFKNKELRDAARDFALTHLDFKAKESERLSFFKNMVNKKDKPELTLRGTLGGKYILRFDDACPTLDRKKWQRMEDLCDKYNIKPIVAVIPNNKDPEMMIDDEDELFWDKVRNWQKKGWHIALHGYDHKYISNHSGLVSQNITSEFAGLEYEIQAEKIIKGIAIFEKENIKTNIWVAPSHTFDENTLRALKAHTDIEIISDGASLFPFIKYEFNWIPQQYAIMRKMLFGIWTGCFHPNTMSEKEFLQLEKFLEENHQNFIDVNDFGYKKMSLGSILFSKVCWYLRKIKNVFKK